MEDDIKRKKRQKNADKKIANGDSPETFLKNYTLDEETRDVICFRGPHIRDFQIGDFVKLKTNQFGFIAEIRSQALNALKYHNSLNNFLMNNIESKCINTKTTLGSLNFADLKEIEILTKNNTQCDYHTELVIAIISVKGEDIRKTFFNIVNDRSTNTIVLGKFQVGDVVKIYKNIHKSYKDINWNNE